MMDESNFHELADEMLTQLAEEVELGDSEGIVDVDIIDGILTLELPESQEIVLNKHAPSSQIWMSSPSGGASYFTYDEDEAAWVTEEGTTIEHVLSGDLLELAGLELD